jgi:hypothetical protein
MCIRALFFVSFLSLFGLSGCGGVSGENGSDPFSVDDSTSTETIKIGFFDQSGQFVEGQIGVSLAPVNGVFEISAGGSVGLNVALVNDDNQRVSEAYLVEFTSNCVAAEQAILGTDISTVNGEASSTYTDDGCAGSSGTKDQITARVVTTDTTLSATQEIDIRPEVVGSIGFLSVASGSVLLRGTGDSSESQSTVSFSVLNQNGTALAGQVVSFSLTTEIGGIELSVTSAISDESGQVQTLISAGNVPTSVRVNASITDLNGEVLTTQSSAISITTGLPSQRTFTLSADVLNVEGFDFDGETSNITARLSDTFGNPVPDDTVVTFTSEGGQIGSSCLTLDGACTVIWTSANPRTDNGRVTILASAIGHETLFDSNGNNAFDDNDGGLIDDELNTASGFGTASSEFTGFIDFSEAWRDDNENRLWDSGEPFLDYNNNQTFDDGDGLFNGAQCIDSVLCGMGAAVSIHVRKALRLLVSGSEAYIDVFDSENVLLASNYDAPSDPPPVSITRGSKITLSVVTGDEFANVMPADTVFSVLTDQGDIAIISGDTVANSAKLGKTQFDFEVENTLAVGDDSVVANIQILVTTPKGIETRFNFPVTLL